MLKIEGIYKAFKTKSVLENLTLEVKEGSIFGLIGINGAGKSTLLRLIAGVYQSDAGHIYFDGKDTFEHPEIRKTIAYVSDEQYYPLGATIKSVKVLYETMYDFDEAAYQKYLKIFALDENSAVVNLSKGNKRRCALMFALCCKPKLLLLDEAYDGLEPLTRLRFKKILAELVEDEGITVIISSHNLKELEDICDSFGILEDGHMVSYGDLLSSKSQINKYQLAFNKDIQREDFASLDILHFEKQGRVLQLVVRGEEEETLMKLKAMKPLLVDVLPVNFEELFIYELESRGEIHG